jgi:hypothetical protein
LMKPSMCSAAAVRSGSNKNASGMMQSVLQSAGNCVSTHPAGADVHQLRTPYTCRHTAVAQSECSAHVGCRCCTAGACSAVTPAAAGHGYEAQHTCQVTQPTLQPGP